MLIAMGGLVVVVWFFILFFFNVDIAADAVSEIAFGLVMLTLMLSFCMLLF